MSSTGLINVLQSSNSKLHTLFTWITLKLEEVNKFEPAEATAEFKNILHIHDELNTFLRHIASQGEQKEFDSHYIFLSFSQLYCGCLFRLQKEYPGKIYDSAELLAEVLFEDDVSVNEMTENDKKSNKKKKKSNGKKTYTYSPAKDLACAVLIQLSETFGRHLSSLTPLLLGAIFKNLKKSMDKAKYFHATFATSLMQLVSAILRNVGESAFYNTFFSKFVKLSKAVFENIYSDKQDYPTPFISALIEIWSVNFKQDSFIKDHKNELGNAIFNKYVEGEIGIYGFANDETRITTARTLAEILFHYYCVAGALELEEVLSVYSKIFNSSLKRDVQAGCFESITHFFGLCEAADDNFFESSNYLQMMRYLAGPIFHPSQTKDQSMDSLSRTLRYFEHMHSVLLPHMGDSFKIIMLISILGCGKDTSAGTEKEYHESAVITDVRSLWSNLAQLDLARLLLLELASSFGNEKHIVKQIKDKLIELSTCDNFSIRIHANEVLKVFLSNFPELLSETIEKSLDELSKGFELTDGFPFAVNHGHALIIANLIDCADKNYVSYELIMRITVFATSFIKNHTTSTTSSLYFKGILCWILLIGLVNYRDDQYLLMQSSQLFLFWKVLFTHTYSYRDEDDLYKNLEIRNHALTCLLTFLRNATVGKDLAKQVSYLLTKCSNFNHSVTQKSNKIDKALLTNELRLLQVYLRLHEYIKNDFNSSLLILIVKNFSDPNLYTETTHSLLESLKEAGEGKSSKKGEGKEEYRLDTSLSTLLRQNDGFAFGLSSKINISGVSELNIEPKNSPLTLNSNWPSKDLYWYTDFENEVMKPISPIFSLDYFIMLYGPQGYSALDRYSPRVTTALIDLSMEIFSLVFPYLNGKIQYSVLESLNVSMFSKMTTPLRSVAIAANILVSINKALKIIHEDELSMDITVGQLLLKSVDKLEYYNDYYLLQLKADCVGLICAATSRGSSKNSDEDVITEQVKILIKSVVDIEEPFLRILRALSLVAIYKYNAQNAPFSEIFEVIIALVMDPHPVVHSWSLKAMHVLMEKHVATDTNIASTLLQTLESIAMDPSYGMFGSSVLRYNYNIEFNSHLVAGKIVKNLTETVGPCIPELNEEVIASFKNLTYALLNLNEIHFELVSLEIYENLSAFKLPHILLDQIFIKSAKCIINDAIIIGIGSNYLNSHLTHKNDLFCSSSSPKAAEKCFGLFTLLIRLQKGSLFVRDIDILSWRLLDLYPSSPAITGYFSTWMEESYESEPRWFDKLYLMFDMNKEKLFQGYYKEVEALLNVKGVRKAPEVEIKDEEEESIAKVGSSELQKDVRSSSEYIPWRAKRFILELVKRLCLVSSSSQKLSDILREKVPELIKLSFQASTSRVASMKVLALDILTVVLSRYSQDEDVENPGHSVLEQQEAQIISALMPAFDPGSPPDIVTSAISVCADILGSRISPLQRMSRISQLFVGFLGIFNDKSASIKVGDVAVITQKARRKMELAILNAWAELVQRSITLENEEVKEFTRGYWDVLVPLWILTLREYVMIKYEGRKTNLHMEDKHDETMESQSSKLELYDNVWLNLVISLSCLLEIDSGLVLRCLNETETESFMFILFTQCMEVLVKSIDNHSMKMKLLPALHNILKCGVPLDTLFEDGTNEEIVGILDRLMVLGNSAEQLELIEVINDLIIGYTKQNDSHGAFLQGIDKLYELLRLLLIPVSQILPFIKYNSLEETSAGLDLKPANIALLKQAFCVFESNVSRFDDIFRNDLYACLLFIMGKIYESEERDVLVPTILPLLKSISRTLVGKSNNLCSLDIYLVSIKGVILQKLNMENKLATILILLTSGYGNLSQNDLESFVDILLSGFCNLETQSIASHGLSSLVKNGFNFPCCRYVLKRTIAAYSQVISKQQPKTSNLMLDIVEQLVMKIVEYQPELSAPAFALSLTLIASYCTALSESDIYFAGEKVLNLINLKKDVFKTATNELLGDEQRSRIEDIIENMPQFLATNKLSKEAGLELRNFK